MNAIKQDMGTGLSGKTVRLSAEIRIIGNGTASFWGTGRTC